MWTVWGGGDKGKGHFGGIEPQERVEVELIEFPSKQFQLYSNTRIGNWAEKDKGFGCALSH